MNVDLGDNRAEPGCLRGQRCSNAALFFGCKRGVAQFEGADLESADARQSRQFALGEFKCKSVGSEVHHHQQLLTKFSGFSGFPLKENVDFVDFRYLSGTSIRESLWPSWESPFTTFSS